MQITDGADDPYLADELQKIGSRLGELLNELDTAEPDAWRFARELRRLSYRGNNVVQLPPDIERDKVRVYGSGTTTVTVWLVTDASAEAELDRIAAELGFGR